MNNYLLLKTTLSAQHSTTFGTPLGILNMQAIAPQPFGR